MNLKIILSIFLILSGAMISCSKVNFANAPSGECAAEDCVLNPDGTETYSRLLTVQPPNDKVDILFVVDNSGTMLEEQQRIAARFPNFIQSINHLDWRIAIATTDNYPVGVYNDVNGGEYRDGKLVPFRNGSTSSGRYFIERSLGISTSQTLFQNTIQRPETLACQNQPWNCYSYVSGDERGILTAVKQVLSPNPVTVLRPNAQLHIIFIADEDERSNGGGFPGMALETNDKPSTLVSHLQNTGKRFQLHSIINAPAQLVGNPANYDSFRDGGFDQCVAAQIGNTAGQEYVGCHYALGAALTGGVIGRITDTNYTTTLTRISYNIQDTTLGQIDFNCVPMEIVFTAVPGQPYPASLPPSPYVVNNHTLRYFTFSPALAVGTQLNVQWTCPRGSI